MQQTVTSPTNITLANPAKLAAVNDSGITYFTVTMI